MVWILSVVGMPTSNQKSCMCQITAFSKWASTHISVSVPHVPLTAILVLLGNFLHYHGSHKNIFDDHHSLTHTAGEEYLTFGNYGTSQLIVLCL